MHCEDRNQVNEGVRRKEHAKKTPGRRDGRERNLFIIFPSAYGIGAEFDPVKLEEAASRKPRPRSQNPSRNIDYLIFLGPTKSFF